MAIEPNAQQQAVVRSNARRIVVSAGAGSGKTGTLVMRYVERVLRLEAAGVAKPLQSVLLITYTDKAAGELMERVRASMLEHGRPDLAREVDSAWISTIHSFCNRIVRRHAIELGVDPAYVVLDDTRAGLARYDAFETAAVQSLGDADVRELLDTWKITDLRASILGGWDTVRSKGASPADVLPSLPADPGGALSDFARLVDTVLPEYAGSGQSATILDNARTFEIQRGAALSALEALRRGSRVADVAVAESLDDLVSRKGALRGGGRPREITEAVNAAADVVRQAVLDAHAARWSAAWCRLLAAFDAAYTATKSASSALDFEDLQLLTRRLWREDPGAVRRYREQFLEVMIDEFQDTNQLQVDATGPIVGERACYVGDVQQSIYSFRDADVTLLRDLFSQASKTDDAHACRLTVNYRSHPSVLEPINAIFSSPVLFGDEFQELEDHGDPTTTVVWPDGEPRVQVIVADKAVTGRDWRVAEADALAGRLREFVDEGRARAGDIVVLMRASTTMHVYASALERVGFRVVAPAAGGFFETREVADARALLRVLANPLDAEGVTGLLAGGLGGLSDDALLLLSRYSDQGVWSMLPNAAEAGLSEGDSRRALLIHETVSRIRRLQGRIRLADAVLHAAAVLGPGGGLLSGRAGWSNIQKVARLAADFERTTPADPGAFLHYLEDRATYVSKEAVTGTTREGDDAIRIMTIHSAKGLQFPVVAVADLGHGNPGRSHDVILDRSVRGLVAAVRGPRELCADSSAGSTEWREAAVRAKSAEQDEEDRVFYVACTRAEQALLLSGAADMSKEPSGPTTIERLLGVIRGRVHDGISLYVYGAPACANEAGATGEHAQGPAVGDADVVGSRQTEGGALDVSSGTQAGPGPACEAVVSDSGPGGLHEPLPQARPISAPKEMSYTAFALYEACAYRFFAERMLKVGALPGPRDNDPLAFGSALHAALELVARGESVDEGRLRAIARAAGVQGSEIPRLSAAVMAVTDSEVASLLTIGRPEVDFALRVGDVVVRGSLDLLVTDGPHATVLDYKTGTSWDATAGRYEPQAEVYAFAMLEAGAEHVDVRFVHVEAACEEASFSFGRRDALRIRRRIERSLEHLAAGEFPRLSAFSERYCSDCPVSGSLCPVVHPGTHRREDA